MLVLGILTEVTNEICPHSIGCPLSIYHVSIALDLEPIMFVTLYTLKPRMRCELVDTYSAEFLKTALVLVDLLDPAVGFRVTLFEHILEGL